ncbi:AAA family ATPase [Colletotrichum chrysophilum]|uniref:AAA family ATPase n=1 Tax=Colletotrichum chrysophilum TaxID=1836956 RepID=A0AAD9B2T9_9PEZI|nr:AAA family ATPase [Colletotrichum chrysophilum]
MEAREKALEAWDGYYYHEYSECYGQANVESDINDSPPNDKWSNFPSRIHEKIHEIERADPRDINDRFYWEQRFLDLLVDPREVEKGWSDIAIDPQTEREICDVIAHHMDLAKPSTSYGILKSGNTGGALLYGPPGTGKTQLARVLACQPELVVICASSADIENKWAGEMPKAIRGLFNLGKLLAPSVIFIDEADSLFASRNSDTQMDWRRNNINQMLAEMDGMTKSAATPFVLLSTNHPSNLDPAVLRRVPTHLYLGLPSTALRIKLFDIFLREEIKTLAFMTHHYSGSDIRNMCVQAAIMCDTFVENEGQGKKRLLNRAVFEKALERTRPTATKASIAAIRSFAKSSDPATLRKMQDFEADELRTQRQHGSPLEDGAGDNAEPGKKFDI